jgi:hypothetical protein
VDDPRTQFSNGFHPIMLEITILLKVVNSVYTGAWTEYKIYFQIGVQLKHTILYYSMILLYYMY